MGNPVLEPLVAPLRIIDRLFEEKMKEKALRTPDTLQDEDWGFEAILESCIREVGIEQIPSLESANVDDLEPNTIVRFRGMVQDMFDPECYVGAFEVPGQPGRWQTSAYREVIEGLEDVDPAHDLKYCLWDRRPYYCVPVPGEARWSREARASRPAPGGQAPPASTTSKRGRDECDAEPEAAMQVEGEEGAAEGAEAPGSSKRAHVRGPADGEAMLTEEGGEAGAAAHCSPCAPTPSGLNLPLEGDPGNPCIVKLYGSRAACAGGDAEVDGLKLNDVVDFVGVLCKSPALAAFNEPEADDFMAQEHAATNPPCSQVVRLHAVMYAKVAPGCPPTSQLAPAPPAAPAAPAAEARASLIRLLASCLGGDELAAEYLLLHLMSRVHTRCDPLALGKFALNLTGCPIDAATKQSPVVQHISEVVGAVAERAAELPLTLQRLNTGRWAPVKDYSSNRLVAGCLQLPAETFLVMDETRLQAGLLQEPGLRNLQALKDLVEWQKVEYDFTHYQMTMPCDVAVLVLSEGKSLLREVCDAELPLRPAHPLAPAGPLAPDQLATWRAYLGHWRHEGCTIPAAVSDVVQQRFVAARTEDPALSQDHLHRWLTLARLMALSWGETELTVERWDAMKTLESRREERLRVC